MASTSTGGLSDKRLYVGNLSASVDEYSLMQVCAKYGKISKLDYLFHKTGPQKGKPRGYAFVEYATREEAQRAMLTLHDKVLRGRKLVVSLASEQDPKEQHSNLLGKKRKPGGGGAVQSEVNRPTAISLLKGQGVAHVPTNRKIAALEAKLALMQKKKDGPTTVPSGSGSSTPQLASGAEEWLNELLPNESTKEIDDASNSTRRVPSTTTTTTNQIDSVKAGLPARPHFESKEPPREL